MLSKVELILKVKNVSNSRLHSAAEMSGCLLRFLWPNTEFLQDKESLPVTKCYYDYVSLARKRT